MQNNKKKKKKKKAHASKTSYLGEKKKSILKFIWIVKSNSEQKEQC
jgi:hypothetical protein